MRRLRVIHDKVGGQDDLSKPFPDKPKGMHCKTYAELQAEDVQLNRSVLLDMQRELAALTSRIRRA